MALDTNYTREQRWISGQRVYNRKQPQLLNAAYERMCAVLANEVFTLQIVQTEWD